MLNIFCQLILLQVKYYVPLNNTTWRPLRPHNYELINHMAKIIKGNFSNFDYVKV